MHTGPGDRMVLGSIPAVQHRFRTLTIPFTTLCQTCPFHLPVSFGGDTKNRQSLLSGGYARRGSQISHLQSALEMCNPSWTPPLLEKDNSNNNPVYNTQV